MDGVLAGTVLLGLVPSAGYYLLGVLLARRPVWLGLAWLVSLVPLAMYLFIALLSVIRLTGCPPDAYGCPLWT